MYNVIFVIFLIVIAIWLFKKITSTSNDSFSTASEDNNKKSEPRDFLKDADGWLNTPKPLKEMLDENRSFVIDKLIELLNTGGTYERKYAAFALGQIGEKRLLQYLENRYAIETIKEVRAAIRAAKISLIRASLDEGFSEMDRRKIITIVYDGLSSLKDYGSTGRS